MAFALVGQFQGEGPVRVALHVAEHGNADRQTGLPRRKRQRAAGRLVIDTCLRGPVRGGIRHCHRPMAGSGKRDRENGVLRATGGFLKGDIRRLQGRWDIRKDRCRSGRIHQRRIVRAA